jgi:hypothetical protein
MSPENKPPIFSQPTQPAVPTMTTKSVPSPPIEEPYYAADELDDSIVAAPLVMPDFTHVTPVNKQVEFRWVNFKAGDGLRFHQCQAMGYEVAKKEDVDQAKLSPYSHEGGTKFINGDLLLMKIDRRKYLGALRHKHNVAAALADDSVQRTVSAKTAAAELARGGAARAQFQGKISVFAPNATDLSGTPLGDKMGAAELERLGGTRDIGR